MIFTRAQSVLVDVLIAPRASRTGIVGIHDGRLKIALAAPPVDGAANEALLAFFAKCFEVRRRDVELQHGARSKRKSVAISGRSEADVRTRIEEMLAAT